MGDRHLAKCLGRNLHQNLTETSETAETFFFLTFNHFQSLSYSLYVTLIGSPLDRSSKKHCHKKTRHVVMVRGIHDIERKIFEARGPGPDGKVQDILSVLSFLVCFETLPLYL